MELFGDDEKAAIEAAQNSIDAFPRAFDAAYHDAMRAKLGLAGAEDGDRALIADLLERMAEAKLDFTNTFRRLAEGEVPEPLGAWKESWAARRANGDTRAFNPAYIPRNHRVEAALVAAIAGDLGPFDELLEVVRRPYEARAQFAAYANPPQAHEVVEATFCGT
jgi:serine/tyrosine/threonine adenylyltransferase